MCYKISYIFLFEHVVNNKKKICTKLSHLKQYYANAITERVPQSKGVNYSIDTTVVQLDESRRTTPSLMMELMCFHQLIINCR